MGRRSARTDGLLALGLLVALVGGLVVLGAAGSGGSDPFEVRRSSYLATPTGTKALHDLLSELGFDVRRQRASLRAIPADASALLVLSAPVALGRDEIRGVVSWVEAGGTLVLTLGGGTLAPVASAANRGSPAALLAEELGVEVLRVPASQYGVTVQGTVAAEVSQLRFAGGRILDGPALASASFRPLVRNLYGVVAGTLDRGRGRVIVFADDAPFTNRTIRHLDDGLLLVRLLAPRRRPGTILFDERHQGYGDDRDAASRLAGALAETGLGLAVIQAALAAGALLYLSGRRFGAARPPPRARRRAAVESATALGRAYAACGAAALAAETLAAGARRRAAPRIGVPPTLPPAEFVRRVRGSRAAGAPALAAALERAAAVGAAGRSAGEELAAATRDVEAALAALCGGRVDGDREGR